MRAKPPAPSSYSLPTLALAWRCDVDQIELYAFDGLQIETAHVGGREVRTVAREEKERFEKSRPLRSEGYNPTLKATHLNVIGALAVIAYSTELPSQPYALASMLATDTATLGIPLDFSQETIATAIKSALANLTDHGYKLPKSAERQGIKTLEAAA